MMIIGCVTLVSIGQSGIVEHLSQRGKEKVEKKGVRTSGNGRDTAGSRRDRPKVDTRVKS